ncbi:MAG: tetratricopeptide repeat protein [Gammaproteobacteria bacterium]|nr:tetratricopeptide repeat protein [Gammaproteobacteria bacterium]
MPKKLLMILCLAATIGLGLTGSLLITPAAHAQAASAKVGPKVGKLLQDALDASKNKRNGDALAKLKEADAISGTSKLEQLKIAEMYGYVYLQQRNYPAAAAAYERTLNSGLLTPAQTNDRIKQIAQLSFPKDVKKTVEYTTRWLKATGSKDPDMYAMLGQAYQLGGNDKAAIKATEIAVSNAQAAGKRPDENWLRILLKSYGNLDDTANVSRLTTSLVTLYPTKENWQLMSSALRRQATGDDRVALNVYRLMKELDLMDEPRLFTESAIISMDAGLPGEAVKTMELGAARKVLAVDDSRNQRIMNDARTRLKAQQQNLPKLEQAAAASKQGLAELQLAEVLMSNGETDKAMAAARRAIQEGGLPDPDDAWMLIGRGNVAKKNGAEARKAFAQVKGKDLNSIARLWSIYASKL